MRVFASALGVAAILLAAEAGAEPPRYDAAERPWAAELGSHRAVVRVDSPADAVRVRLDWCRRDYDPVSKAVLVFQARTGNR
ncbi:MAG TPA: glycoside hydrolase domain-containing protein, partial [Gemmataceae bacterium]|nr:glycoside hydrolase domain-containing protein [Gemmataceae bacterium]